MRTVTKIWTICIFIFVYHFSLANNSPHIVSVAPAALIIPKYHRFELNIEAQTHVINRYNYDSVLIRGVFVSPSGKISKVEGFYFQRFNSNTTGMLYPFGQPFWKLRFTPTEVGSWEYKLFISDIFGIDSIVNQHFTCTYSNSSGFVKASPNSLFLQNDVGKTVFLVGENIAWANVPDGSDRMSYYLQQLHNNEMNFAKLMMTPWGYQIEWGQYGLRNFAERQKQAFLVDSIFDRAEMLGIYLQLAFSIHNEFSFGYPDEDWTSNPYNILNGGMCNQPQEFFSNIAARAAFKNRIRYIVARWGYATHLVGWELLSEADNFSYYSFAANQIAAWSGEMASFIGEKDVNKHLVSVGFSIAKNNPSVWNHPDIGFTQIHHYEKVADIEGDAFRLMGTYAQAYNKPTLMGEFGLGHVGDSLVAWDPDGVSLHNALWTSALSGSFGAVVPWFWENYIDAQQLYHVFKPVARFVKNENFSTGNYSPKHLVTTSNAHSPFVIVPKYNDLTKKSPSKVFHLHSTGQVVPASDSLSKYIYGPSSIFSGLRISQTISGYWPKASTLTIETGSQVINAVLQVWMNGVLVFEQQALAQTIYTVSIPSGTHTFRIDNIGGGLFSVLELNKLRMNDFLPAVRAFALVGSADAMVWVHNRNHNWLYLKENQIPPNPVNGWIAIPLFNGTYQAEWFNTRTGIVDSISIIYASSGGLNIHVKQLSNDVALKIRKITTIQQAIEKPIMVEVFPNPASHRIQFLVHLKEARALRLQIFTLNGVLLHDAFQEFDMEGEAKMDWNFSNNVGSRIGFGVYFYLITINKGQTVTGKFVVR